MRIPPGARVLAIAVALIAASACENGEQSLQAADKVTICHKPPSSPQSVSVSSIVGGGGHDNDPTDIIPPFSYLDNRGEKQEYPGKNWDQQDIYDNGCQPLTPAGSPVPTPAPTPAPTPPPPSTTTSPPTTPAAPTTTAPPEPTTTSAGEPTTTAPSEPTTTTGGGVSGETTTIAPSEPTTTTPSEPTTTTGGAPTTTGPSEPTTSVGEPTTTAPSEPTTTSPNGPSGGSTTTAPSEPTTSIGEPTTTGPSEPTTSVGEPTTTGPSEPTTSVGTPVPQIIEPEDPTVVDPGCADCPNGPSIELAETPGVVYEVTPAGPWAPGQTVTVVARPVDTSSTFAEPLPPGWRPVDSSTAAFEVTLSSGGLARTGAVSVVPQALAAAIAIALGSLVLLIGRCRRSAP